MKCHIMNETNNQSLKEFYPAIRNYFRKTIKLLKKQTDVELTLILVDQNRIQEINAQYRGKDKVTDVITFATQEWGDQDNYLGDIFICIEKVYQQAEAYGHSLKREFCFLFVHGLLHSLGYDHMSKEEEKEMFDLQDIILGDLR